MFGRVPKKKGELGFVVLVAYPTTDSSTAVKPASFLWRMRASGLVLFLKFPPSPAFSGVNSFADIGAVQTPRVARRKLYEQNELERQPASATTVHARVG